MDQDVLRNNIKALIGILAIKQADFARSIDTDPANFNRMLSGSRKITQNVLSRIEVAFGVPPERLIMFSWTIVESAGVIDVSIAPLSQVRVV